MSFKSIFVLSTVLLTTASLFSGYSGGVPAFRTIAVELENIFRTVEPKNILSDVTR